MIETPIWVLVCLVLWALGATGLFLAVFAGASKDVSDMKMNNAVLRESLFEQAKDAVQHNKAMAEMQGQKLELLKKYVDIQNEYAWYRIMMRDSDRKLALDIEARMRERDNKKVV